MNVPQTVRLGWLWATLALCAALCPQRAPAATYNKGTAVSYARKYAQNPNGDFRYYSDNDCTNFVSQALMAGGWTFRYGPYNSITSWYYEPRTSQLQDFSWYNADYLFHFILYSGRGQVIGWGNGGNPANVRDLEPGDLIFADWYVGRGPKRGNDGAMDHAMIVTKKDSDGTIRVSYHSNDHLDRPIQEVMADPSTGQYGRYFYVRLYQNYDGAPVVVSESSAASEGAPGFVRHGTARYWSDAWGVGDGGHMLWTWNNAGFIDNMGDWRPSLPDARSYEVYVFIPRLHGTTRRARYEVYSADGRSDVVVNQNDVYDAWVSLGTYRFNAGAGGLLRLTDMTGERGVTTQIAFDSAKWVPR